MNNNIKNILSLFIIFSLLVFSLAGCTGSQNIDTLAYVIAIGIDTSSIGNLRLTIKIANPNSINLGSSSSSNSDSSSRSTIEYSADCNSFEDGINIINSYISKEITLSHCTVIVFSEEVASKGVSQYIYDFVNNEQIRASCSIVVSKCEAKYFLENTKPVLEQSSARYYETITNSDDYTGFTNNINLGQFLFSLQDISTQPCAILGAVNSEKANTSPNNTPNATTEYIAGNSTINSSTTIETVGMAVFNQDILAGELNNIDSICHLIITNKLQSCNITIPSPFNESNTMDIYVTLDKKTKKKCTIVNGSPYIEIEIKVLSQLLTVTDSINYLSDENSKLLEANINKYLEDKIYTYLYKTSVDYNSDIDNFGDYAARNFSTWDEWKNYNWLFNYKNSSFKVTVDTSLKSGRLLLDI